MICPFDTSHIQCIGFDADDTLWQNEIFYLHTERAFKDLLCDVMDEDMLSRILFKTESDNMETLGYGAKAMTISMIQMAISINPDIASSKLMQIIDIGKSLLKVPTQMLPGVVETLEYLQTKPYRIIIITKGELNEQTRKFLNSPLDQTIDYLVLPDKKRETYQTLFRRERIDPATFLMVGNSPKSDILPPLELGAFAAHIPFHTTWAHEDVPLPDHPRLLKLQEFRQLMDVL